MEHTLEDDLRDSSYYSDDRIFWSSWHELTQETTPIHSHLSNLATRTDPSEMI